MTHLRKMMLLVMNFLNRKFARYSAMSIALFLTVASRATALPLLPTLAKFSSRPSKCNLRNHSSGEKAQKGTLFEN